MKTRTVSAWMGGLLACGLLAACAATQDTGLVGETRTTTAFVEGVPGGVDVEVTTVNARVEAVDREARRVTLVDEAGNRKTVQVGPEAINFDQIEIGDRLTVEVVEELVVYLVPLGEHRSDSGAAVAARAEKGEKPGVLVGGTVELIATVKALDREAHTATLRFSDGSEQTVTVRDDIELDDAYVGREVVLRTTVAFALSVSKP